MRNYDNLGQNSTEGVRDQTMKNLVNYIKDPKGNEKPLRVSSWQVKRLDMCFFLFFFRYVFLKIILTVQTGKRKEDRTETREIS